MPFFCTIMFQKKISGSPMISTQCTLPLGEVPTFREGGRPGVGHAITQRLDPDTAKLGTCGRDLSKALGGQLGGMLMGWDMCLLYIGVFSQSGNVVLMALIYCLKSTFQNWTELYVLVVWNIFFFYILGLIIPTD
jgi:hypothetical protein